jgi:outer membrane protein TolC
MQAAVDVHERLAFARQPAGLGLAQALRVRQAAGDFTIPIDPGQVVRARHQCEVHRSALRRLAGLDDSDVPGRRRELLEIVD